MLAICYYTARIVVITGSKDKDYADTVFRYFGKRFGKYGKYVQIIFNLLMNLGGSLIIFIIIK